MISLPVDCAQRSAQHRSHTRVVGVIRILVFLQLAALLLAPGSVALSSHGWCSSDPVVLIGDTMTHITLSAPANAPSRVTGSNEIVVTIPDTLSGVVVSPGPGFGRGESVSVVLSPDLQATSDWIEVTIQVFVPASDDTMEIGVEFATLDAGLLAPTHIHGVANSWITMSAGFQPALV
jgi:hypothetical protein